MVELCLNEKHSYFLQIQTNNMTKKANIKRKVRTNKIDSDWFAGLREKGFTANSVYDKGQHEDLKIRLLDIGGEAVIIRPPDKHNEDTMNRGEVFIKPKIKIILGDENECHRNSAKIWFEHTLKRQLWSGYALTEDGLWRQHTWVKDGSTVIETTEERIVYYGYKLNEREGLFFYISNVIAPDTNLVD